jgi:glyoxalase family protein
MIHLIGWRVAGPEALDFWERRLGDEGVPVQREGERLRFADPEGLEHELRISHADDEPLIADHPEVPAEVALQGFDGVRAYTNDPAASRDLLEDALGFAPRHDGYEVRGERRGSLYAYDAAPGEPGRQGAGSVHHVAFASAPEEHEAWRRRVIEGGARPTPVIDRFYFKSIYFREPSGVLFEIATIGPGFTTDEPLEHLGERLSLPPRFEPLRERVERQLTAVENPRTAPTRAG